MPSARDPAPVTMAILPSSLRPPIAFSFVAAPGETLGIGERRRGDARCVAQLRAPRIASLARRSPAVNADRGRCRLDLHRSPAIRSPHPRIGIPHGGDMRIEEKAKQLGHVIPNLE